MSNYIPAVGTSGIYTLLSPFDNALTPNVAYTCVSVRRLGDIIAAGGNPLKTYYLDNSLTKEIYETDVTNNACIVSLQGPGGLTVCVPSSYIKSYPDIGGVPYSVIAMAISLGAIPTSMDLSYISNQIVELVRDTIGIDSEVKLVEIAEPSLLTYDDSKALEIARKAKIATTMTDRAMYLDASSKLASARQKIAMLETYIKSLQA